MFPLRHSQYILGQREPNLILLSSPYLPIVKGTSLAMTSNSTHSSFKRVIQLVKASFRPVPKHFGDERYDSDVDPEELKASIVKVLTSQAKRVPDNLQLLIEAISLKTHGGYEDDSKYIVLPPAPPHKGIAAEMLDGTSYSACRFFANPFRHSNFTHRFLY